MNFLFIVLIILTLSIVPFAIGIYKDATKKMGYLKKSIQEHEEYIQYKEASELNKPKRESSKKTVHPAHA